MPFNVLRAAFVTVLALSASWAHALVFAVNEGVTYRVPPEQIAARYAAIAADLGKILRQPVTVEPVGSYPALRLGLAAKAYDIAMVHPAHLSIVAMKQSGYRLLAVTKGFQNYSANFLVKADSPMKSLADLRGKRLGAPDEDSITAWMVRATLREALGDAQQVQYSYTRYQDAVPFFVDNNLTQAGATASGSVIKDWQAKGGKILFKSKPVPIKHLIASPALNAEQFAAVRDYFVSLDSTDDGRKKLEPIKLQGFAPFDEATLMQLGVWLGL